MLTVPHYPVILVLFIKILSVQPLRGLCYKYGLNNSLLELNVQKGRYIHRSGRIEKRVRRSKT